VKHQLAELFMDVEQVKSAAQYASWQAAENTAELAATSSLAKAYASETYWKTVVAMIHIHGGIGFTWEHDAHLYYKRAKSTQVYLGDANHHRNKLAEHIGLGAA
jgi:alkylation response protein AidB-like acyl-CoA dehydrogenase